MASWLRSLFADRFSAEHRADLLQQINSRRRELREFDDQQLRAAAQRAADLPETIAVTAVVAARLIGLEMFDVQLQGSLALAQGKIAEMQTGEGKTLAAVPAVVWYAKAGKGVHVMTVNDYLARRDALWMGPIYEFLGFSVGCIQQTLESKARKQAYACDITYATANEIGFDCLRDQLAFFSHEQVHRPFHAALIDEADSLLIDEARIPLVIAGRVPGDESLAVVVDRLTRHFRHQVHYTIEQSGRIISLTDAGIQAVEQTFRCGNLFNEENLKLFTAVHDSLHAHALLRRDVDYLVKNGAIESVDEFKGRIVKERQWPAGLHSAIEAKEGVAAKAQGRILGSITLQNLISLYPNACGMTGTAATQAEEFQSIYGLEVEVIPTNRPVISEGFGAVGCAMCHTPTLQTGLSPYTGMSNANYNPYSDFALHHMGSNLADGVVQGNAGPDMFRTAPLWGVGQRLFFLHDGRTADLLQAIEAHFSPGNVCSEARSLLQFEANGASFDPSSQTQACGSEANAVINRFNSLSPAQKQQILNFLRSL